MISESIDIDVYLEFLVRIQVRLCTNSSIFRVFKVGFNPIDFLLDDVIYVLCRSFCFYKVIVCPNRVLVHHQSLSKVYAILQLTIASFSSNSRIF